MSQGVYKITGAQQGRTYQGKHGELVVWNVTLENAQPENGAAVFELHKKPGNTPQPGDAIEVDRFSPGEHDGAPFVRIFAAAQQGSSSSTSSGGQSRQSDGPGLRWRSAPYERGAEHPRNEARAIHTSALSAAPAYYELLRTEGVLDKAADKASALNTLAGIVTWLEGGYGPVLDAVSAPAPAAVQTAGNGAGGQQEIPADTEGLVAAGVPTGSSAADDTIPF